jgi:hypothetical protein
MWDLATLRPVARSAGDAVVVALAAYADTVVPARADGGICIDDRRTERRPAG